MAESIRALIVDGDTLFRRATRTVLESSGCVTVVGEAKDGAEAIELLREFEPDVILLDIDTLHAEGLQTVARINELYPNGKIIMLNNHGQEHLVLDAFRRGARGHLVKGRNDAVEILAAIQAVGRGESVLSPFMAGWILDEITRMRSVE